MKIKEAVILAGGLGTRLRSAVPDLPKCMAPVNGRPFLAYIINYYTRQGIEKFIFSLGYKHEVITDWLQKNYPLLNIQHVVENEPLGTGGAILLAADEATEENILVLNGDTLFSIALADVAAVHEKNTAACTLSLKPMTNFERYGVVETDDLGRIRSFKEKQYYSQGLINGGVYLLNVERFKKLALPARFSFEKDYLEKFYDSLPVYGCIQDEYFIDIGIPEDFERAQKEMKG